MKKVIPMEDNYGTYEQIMNRIEAQRFCDKVNKLRKSLDDALFKFTKETGGDFYFNKDKFGDDAKEIIEKGVELLKYLTRKSWPETYTGKSNERFVK